MGDVILRDFDGNTISTFWQCGHVNWELYYSCLNVIVLSPDKDFAVFVYDENASGRHGALCPANDQLPKPGTYILLHSDGNPIPVVLTPVSARIRHPASTTDHSETRVRNRDPCCLISGLPVFDNDFTRLKGAHIFPRGHEGEWEEKGYLNNITDPAPFSELGGPTKIDSIQNILLLRGDIHDAWDSYRFGIHPDLGYVVIPFGPGYDDIAGKTLKLDHIADTRLRPLDDLLRDHFFQGVLRNMKGIREPTWDYEGALEDQLDLSRLDLWGGETGRGHLCWNSRALMLAHSGDRENRRD